MKILLLGDYSAVHKNLKEGLSELGQDVKLASNGDGWKKIPGADFPLYDESGANRYIRKINSTVLPLCSRRFNGYDVTQAITADLFDLRIRKLMYKKIIDGNGRFYCVLPGDDSYTYRAWLEGKYRYMSYNDNPERIRRYTDVSRIRQQREKAYDYVLHRARGLIPINPYELEVPYEGMNNLRRYIPFPINTEKIAYQPNRISNGKMVFYHSVTRPKDKGSAQIVQAMEHLQQKYPNDVECIIRDMVPYEEWLDIMSRTNVVVDQCKSYSYGMTAALAMARGKIVLSGLEPETLPGIHTPGCPVYNIAPDPAQIICVLENLLEQRSRTEEIGYRGRLFTEKEHDYIKVAKMYLEEWNR